MEILRVYNIKPYAKVGEADIWDFPFIHASSFNHRMLDSDGTIRGCWIDWNRFMEYLIEKKIANDVYVMSNDALFTHSIKDRRRTVDEEAFETAYCIRNNINNKDIENACKILGYEVISPSIEAVIFPWNIDSEGRYEKKYIYFVDDRHEDWIIDVNESFRGFPDGISCDIEEFVGRLLNPDYGIRFDVDYELRGYKYKDRLSISYEDIYSSYVLEDMFADICGPHLLNEDCGVEELYRFIRNHYNYDCENLSDLWDCLSFLYNKDMDMKERLSQR